MIDDESHVDPRDLAETGHFNKALLYDFAKFLTTLSLLGLGGVLTLTKTADKAVAKPLVIGFVAGMIALAGVCAVSAASTLAHVTLGKRKPKLSPQQLLATGVVLLGMGAGGFLFMWWKTL